MNDEYTTAGSKEYNPVYETKTSPEPVPRYIVKPEYDVAGKNLIDRVVHTNSYKFLEPVEEYRCGLNHKCNQRMFSPFIILLFILLIIIIIIACLIPIIKRVEVTIK